MNENLNLTKHEAYALAQIIKLFDIIWNDTEIDITQCLCNVLSAYKKLCDYSGFVGLTMDNAEVSEDAGTD